LEIIRLFSVDIDLTEADFAGTSLNALVDKTFAIVTEFYKRKSEAIGQQAYPVLKDVYNTRGNLIET